MTNRIFRAIFLVAAAVMLAVSLLTMGMMYQFSAEETTEKLQRETEYIALKRTVCGIWRKSRTQIRESLGLMQMGQCCMIPPRMHPKWRITATVRK